MGRGRIGNAVNNLRNHNKQISALFCKAEKASEAIAAAEAGPEAAAVDDLDFGDEAAEPLLNCKYILFFLARLAAHPLKSPHYIVYVFGWHYISTRVCI
jgi:hypothetical protein